MSPQTSYKDKPANGRVGMLSETGKNFTQSVRNGAAPTPLDTAFGRLVKFVGDNQVAYPAAVGDITTTQKVAGVVLSTFTAENGEDAVPSHAAGKPFDIVRKGKVYVLAEQDITPEDDVFVRFAANAGASSVQDLDFDLAPDAGTYTLTILGKTTPAIDFNETAANVQDLCEALGSVGVGNIAVAGHADTNDQVFTFQGDLALMNVGLIEIDVTDLTHSAGAVVATVTEDTAGEDVNAALGAFRMDADDATAAKAGALAHARFASTALKGEVVLVDLDL